MGSNSGAIFRTGVFHSKQRYKIARFSSSKNKAMAAGVCQFLRKKGLYGWRATKDQNEVYICPHIESLSEGLWTNNYLSKVAVYRFDNINRDMVKFDGTDGERIRKATGMAGTWTGEMATEAEGYEDVPEYIKGIIPAQKMYINSHFKQVLI